MTLDLLNFLDLALCKLPVPKPELAYLTPPQIVTLK
jgi:hypothetical protein